MLKEYRTSTTNIMTKLQKVGYHSPHLQTPLLYHTKRGPLQFSSLVLTLYIQPTPQVDPKLTLTVCRYQGSSNG